MNLPGIFKIEHYPCSEVTLTDLKNYKVVDLSAYTPTAFDFIPGSASLSEKEKQHSAGDYHEITIPFEIAGNDTEPLEAIKRSHHLFVVTDNNKDKYLVGFADTAFAEFGYSQKIDSTGTGGRSIKCQISWKTNIFPVYVV